MFESVKARPPAGLSKRTPGPYVYLNEGPRTVGMMTIVLSNGGSIDAAIRDVAANGPHHSRKMFRGITDDADTRIEADMVSSLRDRLSAMPEGSSTYSMAIHMVISASDAKEQKEKDRMLKEASEIALQGLREAGKSYSSSLNVPCMTVFGVGIMIPMVLMSVLPMLSMSGMFGSGHINASMLTGVTLFAIPAFVICVILSIRARNPFAGSGRFEFAVEPFLPMLSALPVYLALSMTGLGTVNALCISMLAAGVLTLASVMPKHLSDEKRRKQDSMLRDAVFDMGNRLMSGMAFEEAFSVSVGSRRPCLPIAEAFRNECLVCRGDVASALRNAVSPVSEATADTFCSIYEASLKDLRDAGRLALSVGRQLRDQESVRKTIRSDLRSMTDTMFGTAAVFAPLVLGMSVSMLGPLSRIAEGYDVSGTSLTLAVYLTELCALIALLVSVLEGHGSVRDVVRRFAFMLPISMAVFMGAVGMRFRIRSPPSRGQRTSADRFCL